MALLLLHIILLCIFIMATAHEGVFLIPAFSFAGIALMLQSTVPSVFVKAGFMTVGLICLFMFLVGFKNRANWWGIVLNVANVYLWCWAGYCALMFMHG